MMRHDSHEWTYEDEDAELVVEGEVSFTATEGDPGYRYNSNGDGLPPSPPEVEFYDPKITKITLCGEELPVIDKRTLADRLTQAAATYFAKANEDELIDHILAEHCEPDEPEYEPKC